MLSHFSRVQLFVTSQTVAYQAPLSIGFSRQEHCSGSPFPPPGDLLNQGIKPVSLASKVMLKTPHPLRIRWPKYWSFSFRIDAGWTTSMDGLQDGLVGSPCCPWDYQESSPTPQFKNINSLLLSFLYSPTLTSIRDNWKNHSFDQMDLCWQSNVSVF